MQLGTTLVGEIRSNDNSKQLPCQRACENCQWLPDGPASCCHQVWLVGRVWRASGLGLYPPAGHHSHLVGQLNEVGTGCSDPEANWKPPFGRKASYGALPFRCQCEAGPATQWSQALNPTIRLTLARLRARDGGAERIDAS
ncbi:unnamed protein product [Protopolystoma xenopodis]|uniref:Uncharacterized protein n=1 Tax=Protopolystoma xenopodis TaxID=117903 RepID=A0A448XQH1_9PLAT|nr:unnamed protein product [Protopolystoma xenopodis]